MPTYDTFFSRLKMLVLLLPTCLLLPYWIFLIYLEFTCIKFVITLHIQIKQEKENRAQVRCLQGAFLSSSILNKIWCRCICKNKVSSQLYIYVSDACGMAQNVNFHEKHTVELISETTLTLMRPLFTWLSLLLYIIYY